MLTHIFAPARWCNQKRMMEWCPGWRRPKSQTLLQVDVSQLTDATFYIGYDRRWSVAVKLYGQIVVLQKTGWVQPLCPPRSSFSAPLPSQRISCRWEPSSWSLLQSEQHVPQRNETARPTEKKHDTSVVWLIIIINKKRDAPKLAPFQIGCILLLS